MNLLKHLPGRSTFPCERPSQSSGSKYSAKGGEGGLDLFTWRSLNHNKHLRFKLLLEKLNQKRKNSNNLSEILHKYINTVFIVWCWCLTLHSGGSGRADSGSWLCSPWDVATASYSAAAGPLGAWQREENRMTAAGRWALPAGGARAKQQTQTSSY